MKSRLHLLLAALLLARAAAQDPFTHEANGFLFSHGDFNNDSRQDLVVVDQTTGSIRLATQQSNGSFTWGEAQPSGIESPEALSIGRFYLSTHDAIALGSTTSNRIHLYGITNPAELFTPSVVYPSAPGPLSLAAFNIDNTGTTDLIAIGEGLAPLSNKGPGRVYEAITSVNGTPATTWSSSFPVATRRVNPVRPKAGATPRILEIYGTWGGTTSTLYLENVGPAGLSGAISGGSIATDSRYSVGSLDATTLTHILSWLPDETSFRCQRVNEPSANNFTFGTAATFNLAAPIRHIVPIQQGAGARIAVLLADGSVRIYQFDGSAAPVLLATPHASGADLILPVGSGDLLIATGVRGPAPTWRRLTLFGGAYVNAHIGTLPAARPSARVSNILFLSAEPFVTEGVEPRALRQFRDWTTTATAAGGISWTVQSLAFDSPASGLGTPQSITTSAKSSGEYPLLNQYSPALSIHSLDPRSGTELADIVFDPPPGLYNAPTPPPSVPGVTQLPVPVVSVRVAATEPGFTIYYRSSAAADYQLVPADGTLEVTATTTYQVYGKLGSRRTPVRSATYTIAAPPPLAVPSAADANGNGLADAWEAAFNVSDPNGDADLDGYNNGQEYLAGGDPQSFGYLAAIPPELTGSLLVGPGDSHIFRLEWPAGDTVSTLEQSATLQGWTTHPGPVLQIGNKHRLDVLIHPLDPPQFYRLRR